MTERDVSELFYSFAGPLLILALVYFILIFFGLHRFKMVFDEARTHRMIGLFFYFFITIFSLLRTLSTLTLAILSIKEGTSSNSDSTIFGTDENRIFVNIFYLPEMVFPPIFFFLYWQLLVLFFTTHLDSNHDESDLPKPLQLKTKTIMFFVILFSTIFGIIIFVLSTINYIDVPKFFYFNSLFNFGTPMIVLVTQIYLHIIFSGLPYKSLFAGERKGRVNKAFLFWVLGRALHGVIDILAALYEIQVIENSFNSKEVDDQTFFLLLFGIFVLVGEKIFIEIIPILMMYDMDFVRAFFIMDDCSKDIDQILLGNDPQEAHFFSSGAESSGAGTINRPSLKNRNTLGSSGETGIPEISIRKRGNSNYNENLGLYLNYSKEQFQYKEMDPLRSYISSGLGTILLAHGANKELLAIRKIKLKSLNNYLKDDLSKDFNKHVSLQLQLKKDVVNMKGIFFEENKSVNLIYEGFNRCSLRDFIYNSSPSEKHNRNTERKLNILIGIASIMEKLHSLSEPVYHGHLTPNNIFVLNNDKIKVGDVLFTDFKKYCSVAFGYSNKSRYSSPEILSSDMRSPLHGPEDVYSFAIIAWELFTMKEPFVNLKTKDWMKFVIEESLRPKIEESRISKDMAHVIRLCWQKEKEKRPTFAQLGLLLRNYLVKCEKEEGDDSSDDGSFQSFKTGS